MGKGLSEQQKAIHVLAYRNRQRYGNRSEEPSFISWGNEKLAVHVKSRDIFAKEVLIYYHRWVPFLSYKKRVTYEARGKQYEFARNSYGFDNTPCCWLEERDLHDIRFGQLFDKDDCGGEAEYNKTMASMYRAFKRLKQRGLLEDTPHAYYLTTAGIVIAKEIISQAQQIQVSH